MKCNPLVQNFNQAEKTTIAITPKLRSRFCNVPTITVYHRRTDGKYEAANVSVQLVGMPLTSIIIDHGGRATGVVKIQ